MKDSFLLDEVRCGFMVPATIKQAWAAELEVLVEIDRVCKMHNIQYFADWGTLLGAVRHGGFIPWDDDMDIVMKREDYHKFMTVARYDMKEGFDVQTFRNHDDCWLFMGKVVGRNGFSFEKEHLRRFHNFPYIACVDIFVLDYTYRDKEKEERRRKLCKYMLSVADSIVEGSLVGEKREQSLLCIEEMCGSKICRMEEAVEQGRCIYGEVEKIFAEVQEQESDFLTHLFPWGLKGDGFRFAKECYEQCVYMPFEYVQVPVPVMYDKVLKELYGDYRRIVKDAGDHNYPFFEGQKQNLQKVLDFELPEFRIDKEKMLRGPKDEESKNRSYKVMARECVDELWRLKEQILLLMEKDIKDEVCQERIAGLLQSSQQLAIDLGNMLEQILGDGITIIGLLEQYCEKLYEIYELLLAQGNDAVLKKICQSLCDVQEAIATDLEQNIWNRKVVLFLPVFGRDWSGLQELWHAAVGDSSCDVYVVPLPYYYKDYDGSPRNVCCDVSEFPVEVPVMDYKLLSAEYMEMLHPEVIVIQNPYDNWNAAVSVPELFYSENVRRCTDKLVYVPPFQVDEYTKQNKREYFNMKYYVTMPGGAYADCIAVQSENMRQMYIEKFTEFAGEETKEFWERKVVGLTFEEERVTLTK